MSKKILMMVPRAMDLIPLVEKKVITLAEAKDCICSKKVKADYINNCEKKLEDLGVPINKEKVEKWAHDQIMLEIDNLIQACDKNSKVDKNKSLNVISPEAKSPTPVIRSIDLLPIIKGKVISVEEGEKLIDSRKKSWENNFEKRLKELGITGDVKGKAAKWAESELAEEKKKLGISELPVIKASDVAILLEKGLLPGKDDEERSEFAKSLIDSKRDNWIRNCKEKQG